MLTKLTNLVQALTELPSALHACVKMAREQTTLREELDRANEALDKHAEGFVDNLEYASRIASNAEADAQLERFISDERWAWARERIEKLGQQLEQQLSALDGYLERECSNVVAHEPAVPRCRTCRFFEQEVDRDQELGDGRFLRPGGNCTRHAFGRTGLQRSTGSPMPGDGSGYCSEHQEAMVAGGIGALHHEV